MSRSGGMENASLLAYPCKKATSQTGCDHELDDDPDSSAPEDGGTDGVHWMVSNYRGLRQASLMRYTFAAIAITVYASSANACWWIWDDWERKVCEVNRRREKQLELCREESWDRCRPDSNQSEDFESPAYAECLRIVRNACMVRNGWAPDPF